MTELFRDGLDCCEGTPTRLGQARTADATVTDLYTAPAGVRAVAVAVDFCNSTGGGAGRTCRLFVVPSAGAAGPGNAILYDEVIAWPGSLHYTGPLVLEPGDKLQMQSDGAGLTGTVCGYVQSI
jgi:hypothetical protein